MENKGHWEEFEPYCTWQKDEAHEIRQIHVQGFRKENLRVQLNNAGVLLVTGERVEQTKKTRFRKEIRVPDSCVRNEIRAKLTGGILYITMPKKSFLCTSTKTKCDSPRHWRRRYMFGLKSPLMDGKLALKLGALAAVVVVVSVGAYMAYKYHKCLHGDMTTN